MKAIVINEPGGPDQLKLADINKPALKPGQALVKIHAAGVNFIDVYHRSGLYKVPMPFVPGVEGAGVVEAVADGVTEIAVGDRVAYTMNPGAYAEYAAVTASALVHIPDGLNFESAAASILQGMTAHYLSTTTYPLKPMDTALIHAAAGGTGQLLIQCAKRYGAKVIGTVSTKEKAELALAAGADEVINYAEQDFEDETKRITGGRGVQVVYDSVGKTTFDKSLKCLSPRGMLVSFGQSSGSIPPFDITLLSQGSLFLTRPSLNYYVATRDELLWRAGEIFDWIKNGELKIKIDHTFPLAEAPEAHRWLEARKTTGKLLLVP